MSAKTEAIGAPPRTEAALANVPVGVKATHRPSVAGSQAATSTRQGWRIARLVRWTRSWSFVGTLVVGYVVMGFSALADDRYLDDEGILTHLYADFLRRDFTATFFWLKSHPALALLNLPGAALGLNGFFVLHVLIGAAGVLCIAIAARRAGIREVGIAPLALATSPLYVAGGASGIANVDGAAVAAGALALCLGPSPGIVAGLVAGTLPFVRFELALLTLSLALIGVRTARGGRFLAGIAAVPLGYVAAGALYHGNLLWFIDFPPAWGQWDPASFAVVAASVQSVSAGALVRSVGVTLPALPLLLLLPYGRGTLRPFEAPLLAYVIVFVPAITLLPFARVAFGFNDRYYLTALPAVALLAACAADRIPEHAGRSRLPRALAAIACAVAAAVAAAWALAGVALATAVIVAAGAGVAAGPALTAVSAVMLVGLAATLPRGYRGHPQMETVTHWLRDHRAEVGERPIYTNLKLLHAFASRSGGAPGFDIEGLIQPDMRKELLDWSNAENGQRARIWRLAQEAEYLLGADPVDIVEGRVPSGALLVLNTDDIRTEQMFPQRFLEARTQTRLRAPGVLIATVRPPDPAAADAPTGPPR
jgi:hypothetical protein